MRVTAKVRYEGAAPTAVFDMLVDTTFQERKCQANGAVDYDVDVTEYDDGSAMITTNRLMPTDQIPDFVRSFVGDTVKITEIDDWGPAADDGSREGSIMVEIHGAPIKLGGTLRLVAESGGATTYVDADLKASVPLIGGKIEKATEPAITAALRVEERIGTAWLAERR